MKHDNQCEYSEPTHLTCSCGSRAYKRDPLPDVPYQDGSIIPARAVWNGSWLAYLGRDNPLPSPAP